MEGLEVDSGYYVYVHLRDDNGYPFYFGKGHGKRAWDYHGRNQKWRRIVEKYGIRVEILHAGLTEKEAFSAEVEEIRWARQYFDLANLTDGGEGPANRERVLANQQAIRDFHTLHDRFPSRTILEERKLAVALTTYTSNSQASFDPVFADWARSMGLGTSSGIGRNKRQTQDAIKAHFLETGRLPSTSVEGERRLAERMHNYCNINAHTFDAGFRKWCEDRGYGEEARKQGMTSKKGQVKDFYHKMGRFPSPSVPEERSLYHAVMSYCATSHVSYDPEFSAWCRDRGYGMDAIKDRVKHNKERIRQFVESSGRMPSQMIKEEQSLYWCLQKYVKLGGGSYDPDFAAWAALHGYGAPRKRKNT